MKKILAIDGNINNFKRHKSTWEKHGIEAVRVSSMREAIEKLLNDEFIIIGINGDCRTQLRQRNQHYFNKRSADRKGEIQ